MATHSAPDLNTKALPMGGYGNAAIVFGSVTPTSGALASVYRPVRIPAGMTVTGLKINNDDLDTGGTAFAVKIGYSPVSPADGPVGDDDYFSAGTTILSAANLTDLRFDPIKFEKDVYVDFTVTLAAATFTSGDIIAIVTGDATGVK
ncbi:hypothetical protein SAMN05216299_105145 [Nitrosospira sp. Nsp14]|uniref:hypothetical protein n=1 Tax=Nitrosospira sp. Nsp14 TaxID=1855333 RepID=UPI0008E25D2F|nr:hypothetical protein [Nitrosospira sp. Nsp14]SFH29455.1 hypothetical protein SAMN05216299_105145 [Nitrosospira sp. Nsp14]